MKRKNLWKRMKKCYMLYLFLLPAVLMIAVFCYAPMYGVLMAFQNYSPSKGITGSSWVADREKYADIEYLFSDSRFPDSCDPGIDD